MNLENTVYKQLADEWETGILQKARKIANDKSNNLRLRTKCYYHAEAIAFCIKRLRFRHTAELEKRLIDLQKQVKKNELERILDRQNGTDCDP